MRSRTRPQLPFHEAVVIGSGISGIAALHLLRERGFDAVALERSADVGGTWFKNRYPGCRFDSESYTYGYSFSKEVLDEWHWKERFSAQPETLKYLQFVCDRLDLRGHIRFNTVVSGATWDDDARAWTVDVDGAPYARSRYLITCLGQFSTPTYPRIDGIETFQGPSFHTFDWPAEGVDLAGRRVGVVGTGATGVQAIAAIAPVAGSLTVFQRRPNWHTPLRNSEISEAEMEDIRSRYDEIFALCAQSPGGYLYQPNRDGFWEVGAEERHRYWEEIYQLPGFAAWLMNYREIFFDARANAEFSAFVADKIRGRVSDPDLAEKLVPRDHGFGVQRVPLETNYYEVYNRNNVELVDLQETPITEVNEHGIRTTDRQIDLDVIVYATGFDAITGAYDRLDLRGVGGLRLREKWADGPRTFLGLMTRDFPNLLMIAGPQSSSSSVNFPRSIETQVMWTVDLLDFARSHAVTRLEPTRDAEQQWVAQVVDLYGALLSKDARSWFTGYNSNIPGREHGTVRHVAYNGGQPKYRAILATSAADGYPQLDKS